MLIVYIEKIYFTLIAKHEYINIMQFESAGT